MGDGPGNGPGDGPAVIVHRAARDGVAWRAAGDEIVILDTNGSVYFGLDRSGALLWRRLVDGATTAELVAALAATAPVDPARATADVDRFLGELRQYGLLQPA